MMTESTTGRLPVIKFSDDADNDGFFTVLNGHLYEFVLANGERVTGVAQELDWDIVGEYLHVKEWDTNKELMLYMSSVVEAIYL